MWSSRQAIYFIIYRSREDTGNKTYDEESVHYNITPNLLKETKELISQPEINIYKSLSEGKVPDLLQTEKKITLVIKTEERKV